MLRSAYSTMTTGFQPEVRALTQKLDQICPRFELSQGQIEIIQDPKIFYSTLKEKIATAERRIFLSSLYIGKTQDELIECLADALREKPDLKLTILTDALRGTREAPSKSSASLLAELMEKHESQVDIRMYHTPHLHGLMKSLVPNRFNEGFGLQHMKIYGFDDSVILSGANLSSDYFSDRQDRYYHFKSKDLSDYYFKIQSTVGSLSYKLVHSNNESKFKLIWPSTNTLDDPVKNWRAFIDGSSKILGKLLEHKHSVKPELQGRLTYVYPVSQFTPLFNKDNDGSTEKKSVLTLLDYANDPKIKWSFTAGYFNMLPEIKKKLLDSNSKGVVITASPFANGFYKSKGVSGHLPDAYQYLSKVFLRDVHKAQKDDDIKLKEWKKGVVNTPNGWSYHAKGFWATSPDEETPSITIIGSSNYTRRAYNFDLESNAIVITRDPQLKEAMKKELDNILEHTTELNLEDFKEKDRRIPTGVVWATKILGKRL